MIIIIFAINWPVKAVLTPESVKATVSPTHSALDTLCALCCFACCVCSVTFPRQLRLDVSEFSREASRLGVDVSAFPPYERLLEVIEARGDARTSKQSTYN